MSRRAWVWSFAVSVLLHILVLLLSPVFIRVGPPPGDTDQASAPAPLGGMQVVRVVPSTDPQAEAEEFVFEDPVDPFAPTRTATPGAVTPPTRAPAGEAREAAPTIRPGEAGPAESPLRTGIRDPRLWVTPGEPPPQRELTPEELHARYMAHLEGRLRAWNDSVAGDAERARRATDWTVKDGKGGRWGVSPEGIHLGGVTLPPAAFPTGGSDPDHRARAEERERTRREIDRQEADAERRRAQQEAARQTRERRDAERQGD